MTEQPLPSEPKTDVEVAAANLLNSVMFLVLSLILPATAVWTLGSLASNFIEHSGHLVIPDGDLRLNDSVFLVDGTIFSVQVARSALRNILRSFARKPSRW